MLRIPDSWIPDSLSEELGYRIPDSTCEKVDRNKLGSSSLETEAKPYCCRQRLPRLDRRTLFTSYIHCLLGDPNSLLSENQLLEMAAIDGGNLWSTALQPNG